MRSGFIVLLLGALGAAPASAQTSVTLVLTHATLLDGVSDSPRRDVSIEIAGRSIQRIVEGPYTVPAGARVIDVGGRFVVPGFVDAHAHIETLAAARRALESGVTTVRSASTSAYQDVALRELARSGAIAGPDVVPAGVFVTPDLGETILADPRLAPLASGVTTPDALRLLVRINVERGALVIKTRGTERAGLPNTDPRKQVYTEAQLGVIVQEAARLGVPVMAHAHGDEGALAAVRAGVRSIEHGTYLSDSTLVEMKRRGTYFVPTISTMVDLMREDNTVLRLRAPHMVPHLMRAVRRARELGIPVATGSDTDYGDRSMPRIAEEIGHLVEAGYTPAAALRAATTVGAQLLGMESSTGTITTGRDADLLVVQDNPLDDVRTLQDVLVVVSNGRVALERLPFAARR